MAWKCDLSLTSRNVADTKKAGYRISSRIFKLNFFVNITITNLSIYHVIHIFFYFPQLISQYCNRNLSIEWNIQYIRFIRLQISGPSLLTSDDSVLSRCNPVFDTIISSEVQNFPDPESSREKECF